MKHQKSFLDNKFHMILDRQGRLVLNDRKTPSPHNEVQRYLLGLFRSSHRRCSVKKVFLKFLQISRENTYVGVSFRPATLFKRDSNTVVFLWNLWNFKEHLFWRTTEKLLFVSPQNTIANSSSELGLEETLTV